MASLIRMPQKGLSEDSAILSKWYVKEGDTVKTAVRGEYFEFCTPDAKGANPFHLEKKIFTGLAWKLIGTLGTQPLDISALGTHAGTLSEGDDLFVRIRPENVVYYN